MAPANANNEPNQEYQDDYYDGYSYGAPPPSVKNETYSGRSPPGINIETDQDVSPPGRPPGINIETDQEYNEEHYYEYNYNHDEVPPQPMQNESELYDITLPYSKGNYIGVAVWL